MYAYSDEEKWMKRKIYNIEQDLSNGNLQFESLFYDFHQHICKYTKKIKINFQWWKKMNEKKQIQYWARFE